jgi:hypothetical protein
MVSRSERGLAPLGFRIISSTAIWIPAHLFRLCRAILFRRAAFVVRPPGQHSTRKVRVLTELLIEHFG